MKNIKNYLYKISKASFFLMLILIIGCGGNNNEVKEAKLKKGPFEQFVFSTDNLKRYKFPTHINDIIVDRAEANFSEAFMVVIEPEKAPPFHKHDDTEQIFYIIEGTGELTIGDNKEKYKVKPTDVIRIPISTYHSIRADEGNTMRYLCVDAFGDRQSAEPTWDDHVKVLCKTNNWDYNKVVSSGY